MVLSALVIDPVELRNRRIWTCNFAVPKEAPNLSERHAEGFLPLCNFNLLAVHLVPLLQLTVVAQQDILAFLFDLSGVGFEVHQVGDVNQLFEGVLLHLFGTDRLGSNRLRVGRTRVIFLEV